jgi:hypothetical protein
MSINLDFKVNATTLIAIAIGVGAFFYLNGSKNKTIERWKDNYEVASNQADGYFKLSNRLNDSLTVAGRTINVLNSEVKELTKSDSIQRGLVRHYRNLASVTKIETVFEIDTVEVLVPMMTIPDDTTITVVNPCYELDLRLKSGSLLVNSIDIQNRQDIVLGERKKGIWRTEQAFDIRNSNPCITNVGITTYNVVVPKKWHEKWWITIPSSFGLGYVAGKIN